LVAAATGPLDELPSISLSKLSTGPLSLDPIFRKLHKNGLTWVGNKPCANHRFICKSLSPKTKRLMRNKNNLIQSYTHASNQASSGEEELACNALKTVEEKYNILSQQLEWLFVRYLNVIANIENKY
jgi:hypothetical protein